MNNALTTITWDQARKILQPINPEMTAIIDQLAPDESMPLYHAQYNFGEIIDNGKQFHFPDDGQLRCLSDHSNTQLARDFNYAGNYIPIGILIDKRLELFVDTGSSIIPSQIFQPGDIFALSLHLEKNKSLHPTPAVSYTHLTLPTILLV